MNNLCNAILIKDYDYVEHRFWTDHKSFNIHDSNYLNFLGSIRTEKQDGYLFDNAIYIDVYSFMANQIIIRWSNEFSHCSKMVRNQLERDVVKLGSGNYPNCQKILMLYKQSTGQVQVDESVCQKCKAEIKERVLFNSSFTGCLC